MTRKLIYDIIYHYPDTMRPPCGSKNKTVMNCARGKRVITWSLDTGDWRGRSAEVAVERLLKQV